MVVIKHFPRALTACFASLTACAKAIAVAQATRKRSRRSFPRALKLLCGGASAASFAGGRSLWRRHSASLTLALKLQLRRTAAEGWHKLLCGGPAFFVKHLVFCVVNFVLL